MHAASQTLSVGQKAGWGLADMGVVVFVIVKQLLVLSFLTNYLSVPVGIAGLLTTSILIFDIITDPIVGYLSDRTNSRWGRRAPWMAIGAVILSLGIIGLFGVPQSLSLYGTIIWVGSFFGLATVGFTMVAIPYGATAGEMVAITTDLCDHRAAHRPEVLDNVECYVAAVQECTSSLSAESPSSHMSTSSNRRSFLPSSATTHGSNDTWAQCGLRPQTTLKSLEATSAEHRNFDIADGLTVQNDVVAAAENTLVNAEGRLQDLRSSGGASDVIEGQREIDEVGDIRARARIALHSELHEHEVRDRQNFNNEQIETPQSVHGVRKRLIVHHKVENIRN